MHELRDIDQSTWDRVVARYNEANFLHAWQWGDMHVLLGDAVVRKGIFRKDECIGVMLGIVKDARRGRYLEVPGGPLIDWHDVALVRWVSEQLRDIGRQHACVFVRMRPQVYESDTFMSQLQSYGFRRAPMHLHAEHTNILQLAPAEDELLAGMRRQTRYEVRQVAKKDITVSYRSGVEAIDEFYAVQKETAIRQGFVAPSHTTLRAQAEAFGDAMRVYRAEKDGALLNLAVVLFIGQEAVYHEAASTPEARSLPGAYGVLWHAIRDAKTAGCSRFNFWGIAYSDDPNHRYAGVTTFKRGFGGEDIAFTPAHDLVLRPVRYMKNVLVETIRKKKRKL